jgi:hypothetical protein
MATPKPKTTTETEEAPVAAAVEAPAPAAAAPEEPAAPAAAPARREGIVELTDWCNDSFAKREFSPIALETFRRIQEEKQRTKSGTPMYRATPSQFKAALQKWLDTGQE